MAVVRKHPAPKFVCGTFAHRYNNWYKKEIEAANQKVEVPVGFQYKLEFPQ